MPVAPVFAIEHRLDPSQLDQLRTDIEAQIQTGLLSRAWWLPWVVYATEIGYVYSGQEYWPVFEASTPGWTFVEDREFIRTSFQKFRDQYGGYQPQGIWAEHFTIICWPIFHSILPRDLQRQLASILFDITGGLDSEDLENPKRLGQIIHSHSFNTSTRFQEFSQETLLIGNIAVGLLHSDDSGAISPIDKATLSRITSDLQNEQQSRRWLDSAKRRAQRIRLRGLQNIGGQRKGDQGSRSQSSVLPIIELSIELTEVNSDRWEVFATIADARRIIDDAPIVGQILAASRSQIFGEPAILPRGFFTRETTRRQLAKWPNFDEKPIRLYPQESTVQGMFSDFKLRSSAPYWLFEVRETGSAIFLSNKIVHPNSNYLLAMRTGTVVPSSIEKNSMLAIDCSDLDLYRIDLGIEIDDVSLEVLDEIGATIQHDLKVDPVGIAPIDWNRAGYSKWVDGDTPAFSVAFDFQATSISIKFETKDEPISRVLDDTSST